MTAPDGPGRHQRQALTLANTLRLLKLPPCSPDLSPVEHLQDDLREKSSHNRIFDSVDPLEIHLESSLRAWSSITHAYAPSLHGLALFIHSRIRNAMSRAARCSAAVTESLNAREGPDCKCASARPNAVSCSSSCRRMSDQSDRSWQGCTREVVGEYIRDLRTQLLTPVRFLIPFHEPAEQYS